MTRTPDEIEVTSEMIADGRRAFEGHVRVDADHPDDLTEALTEAFRAMYAEMIRSRPQRYPAGADIALVCHENSAALDDLLTRKVNGSGLPEPISCQSIERTDANAAGR